MFEIFLIFFIFQVDSDVSVCIRRLASNLTKLKYICQTYIKCSY